MKAWVAVVNPIDSDAEVELFLERGDAVAWALGHVDVSLADESVDLSFDEDVITWWFGPREDTPDGVRWGDGESYALIEAREAR